MRFGILSLLTISVFTTTASAQRRVELNDLGRSVNVTNPRLSPDGKNALVILVRTNYADNRFERSLAIVDVATGAVRELTPSFAKASAAALSLRGPS